MSAGERVTVAVVYVGVVVLDSARLGVDLREILPDGAGLGAAKYFDHKVKKALAGTPGSTYTVDMSADKSQIYFGTLQYQGRYDDAVVGEWQANSRAIEAKFKAKKALLEDAKTNELADSLAIARAAYRRAVGGHRAHVLAMIVESITS